MADTSKLSTCQIVCWSLAGLSGVLVIWATAGAVGGFAALLLGLAFVVFAGLVLTRLVCTGYDASDRGIEAEDVRARMRELSGITGYKAPDDAMEAAPAPAVQAAQAAQEVAGTAGGGAAVQVVRPQGLTAARGGRPDDLKRIKGVGPKLEGLCHQLGFYHFDQIAGWGPEEVAWVDDNLAGFKGRVSRDNWVAQAKILAAGGETEFSRRSGGKDEA